MYHRIFLFSFNNNDEALKFIELLSKHLKGANIIVDLRGTTVRVRIYGSRNDIKSTFLKVKDLVTIVKVEYKKGLKRYPLKYLLTSSELKSPIPIDLIQDILTLKGFKAEIKRGHVITNASLEDIQQVIKKISETYFRLKNLRASPRAKKVIALMVSLTELPIKEILEILLNNGVVSKVKNVGTYVLTCKYEDALKVMRKLLKEVLK